MNFLNLLDLESHPLALLKSIEVMQPKAHYSIVVQVIFLALVLI